MAPKNKIDESEKKPLIGRVGTNLRVGIVGMYQFCRFETAKPLIINLIIMILFSDLCRRSKCWKINIF